MHAITCSSSRHCRRKKPSFPRPQPPPLFNGTQASIHMLYPQAPAGFGPVRVRWWIRRDLNLSCFRGQPHKTDDGGKRGVNVMSEYSMHLCLSLSRARKSIPRGTTSIASIIAAFYTCSCGVIIHFVTTNHDSTLSHLPSSPFRFPPFQLFTPSSPFTPSPPRFPSFPPPLSPGPSITSSSQ